MLQINPWNLNSQNQLVENAQNGSKTRVPNLKMQESASLSAQKNTPFNFYMDSYADENFPMDSRMHQYASNGILMSSQQQTTQMTPIAEQSDALEQSGAINLKMSK